MTFFQRRRPLSWNDIELMQSPAQLLKHNIACYCGAVAIACVALSSVLPASFFLALVAAAVGFFVSAGERPARFTKTKLVAASILTMLIFLEGGRLVINRRMSPSEEFSMISKRPPLGWAVWFDRHQGGKSFDVPIKRVGDNIHLH